MDAPKSNYEKMLEKAKKDGTITYFDSDEDIKKIESMNKIALEIKEEFNRRQQKSV